MPIRIFKSLSVGRRDGQNFRGGGGSR
jgi:hypothetical protein